MKELLKDDIGKYFKCFFLNNQTDALAQVPGICFHA